MRSSFRPSIADASARAENFPFGANAWRVKPHFYTALELRPAAFGQGVFALAPIPAGAPALRFGGELYRRLEDLSDPHHFIQVGSGLFLGPSGDIDDYVNHSCQPNTGLRLQGQELTLVAIEAIAAGEELTFDYATCLGPEDLSVMACGCGHAGCRGAISNRSLGPEQVARYQALGMLPDFVARIHAPP